MCKKIENIQSIVSIIIFNEHNNSLSTSQFYELYSYKKWSICDQPKIWTCINIHSLDSLLILATLNLNPAILLGSTLSQNENSNSINTSNSNSNRSTLILVQKILLKYI